MVCVFLKCLYIFPQVALLTAKYSEPSRILAAPLFRDMTGQQALQSYLEGHPSTLCRNPSQDVKRLTTLFDKGSKFKLQLNYVRWVFHRVSDGLILLWKSHPADIWSNAEFISPLNSVHLANPQGVH